MDGLIQWGLAVVQLIQSFRNPLLDQFFLIVNVLGAEDFYILFFPLVFWCWHKAMGYRLAFLFLFSSWANESLKSLFATPRPYQVDERIYAPLKTSGYGIPSGHTQNTVITWGYLATQLKTRLWWILAIAIPLLVGIGRMYLGDHFPQDVIVGAVVGLALVMAYVAVQPRIAIWLNASAALWMKLALAALFPIFLAITYLSTSAVVLGGLLGFGVGLVLEEEFIRFSPRGEWWKQLVKLLLGLGVALGLRVILKPILGDADLATMLRYAVIGFWFALGAPWIFVATRLAQRESPPALVSDASPQLTELRRGQ